MRSNLKIEIVSLVLISLTLLPLKTFAQFSVTSLGSDTRIKSCDDFPTIAFNDPIDMSNATDVNNFLLSDISAISTTSFSNGLWNFSTSGANASTFYWMSPVVCGAVPSAGRWGQNYDLDTSKYTSLTMRMNTDKLDVAAGGGIKLIWNRSCDYTLSRTVTTTTPVQTGWHNYQIDLSNIAISSGESSNTSPWSSGSITGFAMMPTQQNGANVNIDYIRLEDPSSCGTLNLNYGAVTQNNNDHFNLYIDDDSDPLNGIHKELITGGAAAGAGSTTLSTLGLAPGSYHVYGFMTADFGWTNRFDPWDMSNDGDILVTAGISGGTFSGGSYSGTSTNTGPSIYLRIPSSGIDTSKFKKLSFKLTRSSSNADVIRLFADRGGNFYDPGSVCSNGICHIDLSAESFWTGTTTSLILQPSASAGTTFSLDWVSLRTDGYVNADPSTDIAVVSSSGALLVNNPPLLDIHSPDLHGGEAIKPWNMNPGDFPVFSNLRADADPNNSGEAYTTFLPDVRKIDGIRGDIFKGTNQKGNDDPVNYSTWPFVQSPITIDASVYKNLCFSELLDHSVDVCLGSIARPIWLNNDNTFTTALAPVTVYNRWGTSRWNEYCMDLTQIGLQDANQEPWTGTIKAFRVDAHEFSKDTCGGDGLPTGNPISVTYYLDYIKLRKDSTSYGTYSLAYDLQDADDNANVTFYYNQSKSTSGGSLIGTVSEGSGSYVWDTSAVQNGTYYIYGVASDGLNSTSHIASGRLVVNNGGLSIPDSPILSLEAPTANQVVCNSLQVKGYALEPDIFEDVAAVEVWVDGNLYNSIFPPYIYSIAAKANYPDKDSSNSGFDQSLDFSSFGAGAHTILIKAVSAHGLISTSSVSVVKQGSGCADPVLDPDPAGSPVTVDVPNTTVTTPAISKLSHSAKGALSITVKNAKESGIACDIALSIGTAANAVNTSVVTYKSVSSSSLNLLAKGRIKINKKSLKKIYFAVTKSCEGYLAATSAAKKLALKTAKGAKTLAALKGLLVKNLRKK